MRRYPLQDPLPRPLRPGPRLATALHCAFSGCAAALLHAVALYSVDPVSIHPNPPCRPRFPPRPPTRPAGRATRAALREGTPTKFDVKDAFFVSFRHIVVPDCSCPAPPHPRTTGGVTTQASGGIGGTRNAKLLELGEKNCLWGCHFRRPTGRSGGSRFYLHCRVCRVCRAMTCGALARGQRRLFCEWGRFPWRTKGRSLRTPPLPARSYAQNSPAAFVRPVRPSLRVGPN